MDEQAEYEEFLKDLQQQNYSGEWFFEQWSTNRTITFKSFLKLSPQYMSLLIIKLRNYLRSQNFFYFKYKAKIQRCIEMLEQWEERNYQKRRQRMKQEALQKLELQRKRQAQSQVSLDIQPTLLQQEQVSQKSVIERTLPATGFKSESQPEDSSSPESGFSSQTQQKSQVQKTNPEIKINKKVEAQAVMCIQHQRNIIHEDEEEEQNEEIDLLIKKCQ